VGKKLGTNMRVCRGIYGRWIELVEVEGGAVEGCRGNGGGGRGMGGKRLGGQGRERGWRGGEITGWWGWAIGA